MQAQPYRAGGQRGPSQVLESMLKGGTGAPGAALMAANNQRGPRRGRSAGVMVPRNRAPISWLEDMGIAPAHEMPGGERSGIL